MGLGSATVCGIGVDMADVKPAIMKITTGVAGLDKLLFGGIPENSQVLLIGDVGSGKTLLSFEIIYRNALKGIHATYITTEENKETLVSFLTSTFSGFDKIRDLVDASVIVIDEKKLQYAIKGPENIQTIVADIIKTASRNQSRIMVIDSFSLLRALYPDDRSFTRGMNYVTESIRNQGITCITTFESSAIGEDNRAPGLFEESMFDGIIKLSRKASDDSVLYKISIVKMRYSEFLNSEYRFSITPSGFEIKEELPK